MSHKDAPPETPTQAAVREFYTALLGERGVTVGWGRDKAGAFLAEYARDVEAAWIAARGNVKMNELFGNSEELKPLPLGQLRNVDGFRFIGIDRSGERHYCIIRRGDGGSYYMSSNTALFRDLVGWIPDPDADPKQANA